MNLRISIGVVALLVFLVGCSTQKQHHVENLRNLDHSEVLAHLSSFRESADWPTEKTFERVGESQSERITPIPNQIAALDPWAVLIYPEGPPRIEFAFWVPTNTWQRDTIGLTYVFDDGKIPEGIHNENSNLNGTDVNISANIERIAKSTYLMTSE